MLTDRQKIKAYLMIFTVCKILQLILCIYTLSVVTEPDSDLRFPNTCLVMAYFMLVTIVKGSWLSCWVVVERAKKFLIRIETVVFVIVMILSIILSSLLTAHDYKEEVIPEKRKWRNFELISPIIFGVLCTETGLLYLIKQVTYLFEKVEREPMNDADRGTVQTRLRTLEQFVDSQIAEDLTIAN